jgi:hypothetical protein
MSYYCLTLKPLPLVHVRLLFSNLIGLQDVDCVLKWDGIKVDKGFVRHMGTNRVRKFVPIIY